MLPRRRTANRAVCQSLGKRFREPDHAVACTTQGRIHSENNRVRLASTGGTVYDHGRRNPFAFGQTALHSRVLLRSEAHASNRAKARGLAKRNSEIRGLVRAGGRYAYGPPQRTNAKRIHVTRIDLRGQASRHNPANIIALRSPSWAKEPSASSRGGRDNLPHIEG